MTWSVRLKSLPSKTVLKAPHQATISVALHKRNKQNTKVVMHFQGKKQYFGSCTFELFDDLAPKTVENFCALCSEVTGPNERMISYKLSTIHKSLPQFFMQAGDVIKQDGTSGWSIYGQTFPDENLDLKFDAPGILAMVNTGPNTNNSQFFVTFRPLPWLNGKNVIFGRVIRGLQLLRALSYNCKPSVEGVPLQKIFIDKCVVKRKIQTVQPEEQPVKSQSQSQQPTQQQKARKKTKQ